jgi:hypothetical protein
MFTITTLLLLSCALADYVEYDFQPSCTPGAHTDATVVVYPARCYAEDATSFSITCDGAGNVSRAVFDNIDCFGAPSSHRPSEELPGCVPNGTPEHGYMNISCKTGHFDLPAKGFLTILSYMEQVYNLSCPVNGPPSYLETLQLDTCLTEGSGAAANHFMMSCTEKPDEVTHKEFASADCSGAPKSTSSIKTGYSVPTLAQRRLGRGPLGFADGPHPQVYRCPAA